MTRAPEIGFGDLARALVRLDVAGAATEAEVALLLGLVAPAPPAAERGPAVFPSPPVVPEPGAGMPAPPRFTATVAPARPEPRLSEPEPPPAQSFRLEPAGVAQPFRPPRDVPPLDELLAPAATAVPLADPGLLTRRWQRGILSTALATAAPDGPLDVPRAVARLAAARPLARLPRLPVATLRRGVQVLVDRGEGMQPFADDAAGLVATVQEVVGREAVQVLRFTGTPLRGAGTGTRRTFGPYQAPRRGRPVLLLTDLGSGAARLAGDRAAADEWAAFGAVLRAAGCPALALIPYPRERAGPLVRLFQVIPWDRATSAGTVRRLRGIAGGSGR